ncbi:uncharacterized protein SCHCODRAFT_02625644 [Schizophyllum commune H4-8]|uniref:uncharacterized protein n=1 Tax=Schizophyllum commune (strain H4-8 / FGSC 9210) TaxID=578458 RepID=UPI0021605730|nr:uncharacterized protein SCHCODRAFT_02625644 [Schizophyllum commune H4-8]KAI5892228.1 hypothetical protein SCHCODRAFT_02625644 [Schizophyllum commune H4-8]
MTFVARCSCNVQESYSWRIPIGRTTFQFSGWGCYRDCIGTAARRVRQALAPSPVFADTVPWTLWNHAMICMGGAVVCWLGRRIIEAHGGYLYARKAASILVNGSPSKFCTSDAVAMHRVDIEDNPQEKLLGISISSYSPQPLAHKQMAHRQKQHRSGRADGDGSNARVAIGQGAKVDLGR